MINESAYGLFYYLEDYVPMQKKRANSMLLNGSRKSGTKLAIEYAQKQNLKIININKEETYQEIIKV